MSRTCGDCTRCCTMLSVHGDGWYKPPGVPCASQADGGCSIYAQRPAACHAYRCMWLGGFGTLDDRPDRGRAIFELQKTHLSTKPTVLIRMHRATLEQIERVMALAKVAGRKRLVILMTDNARQIVGGPPKVVKQARKKLASVNE